MIQENISRSEAKITWSLFLVCFCYFIFVLPITFIHEVHGYVHLVGMCIYWLQYSLNFIIYAARIEQYRKAYILFLGEVNVKLFFPPALCIVLHISGFPAEIGKS